MLKENALMIGLIVTILGIGWGYVFLSGEQGSKFANFVFPNVQTTPVATPTLVATPTEKEIEPNFSEEGNVIKPEEDWIFVYEKPGAPALALNLKFVDESECDFGQGEEECDLEKLENGLRVEISGQKTDDTLTVLELIKL